MAWWYLGEVPYYFWRSSVKFQDHTTLKSVEFDPDWASPDCNSSLNSPMATKLCTKLEVALKRCPIVFKVICKISRSHCSKKLQIWPRLGVSGLQLQFEFTNGYEMMHKAWSSIGEVHYCFSRSSFKLQVCTALKIVEFDPNWAFPDCNSNLDSPTGTKWCTKLEVA